jgi:hypothetical protein
MKKIKIYESFRTEQEIEDLCSEYGLYKYRIRDDSSVDVIGDANLYNKIGVLKKLPLTFNEVSWDFNCGKNNLTTLEGCPKKVGGSFYCNYNNLTSLEHSPEIVEHYWCSGNYILTSFEGLENTHIDGVLDVDYCHKLYSFVGFPKKVKIFTCKSTPIKKIYDKFIQDCDYETIRRFNKFDVVYTDGLDWYIDYDNLGKFLRSVGKEHLIASKSEFIDFIKDTEYLYD